MEENEDDFKDSENSLSSRLLSELRQYLRTQAGIRFRVQK